MNLSISPKLANSNPDTSHPHFQQHQRRRINQPVLRQFLDSCHRPEEDEFYLPAAIEDLVRSQIARVRVMPTTDTWCGVTYPGDRELVVQHLSQLVADGRYPRNLW